MTEINIIDILGDVSLQVFVADRNHPAAGLDWELSDQTIQTIRDVDASIRAAETNKCAYIMGRH